MNDLIKILALDVANKTGWATENASGVWDLTPRRDESKGMSLLRLRAKLTEVVAHEGINVVVFERSAGRNKSSIITQSEKHGVVKLFCEQNKLHYKAYSASEVKRHATGKGNCGKPEMVAAARLLLPWRGDIIDDNHADALWIYDIAQKELLI